MMEIGLHPRGDTKQEKKQRGVDQNYAHAFLVIRFHQEVIRN
jgi:hypothetical protein